MIYCYFVKELPARYKLCSKSLRFSAIPQALRLTQPRLAYFWMVFSNKIWLDSCRYTISAGLLPFKYLGVPVSSKRLTITQFQPLIERLTDKILNWRTKFLSYGGRLQLVQSVLFAVENYWSNVFLIPKRVMTEVERICRIFFGLVIWEQVTSHLYLGIQYVVQGNKEVLVWLIYRALILRVIKLLWDINNKVDIYGFGGFTLTT